ncbi:MULTISPECIES: (2Fe-2S)-binding protein [Staphylococcus]|uniref:(2Fe-2S)-binding protein n=1 Tax=Staphylococcus xylosus TaxID=1288 RepID=A0A418IKM1_STAXY|nr:(2Fe-2S)-binding protein [Staphylococcus xylosus]NQD98832.1 (2Fe-2S)-binding protein [Staphylococcus xylosus]RIN07923.1 (2Fe-2S)-binding protein [Staphylococcus xylosus]
MTTRITDHPILGKLENQKKVNFTFDNTRIEAFEGDTIASALLAAGYRKIREHEESGNARGIYCNIGHCFECRVQLNDKVVRACITSVQEGISVYSLRK